MSKPVMVIIAVVAVAVLVGIDLWRLGVFNPPAQAPGIANPASTNCVNLGGTLEIKDTASGQVGVCHLPDGRACEEWALYRDGTCTPAVADGGNAAQKADLIRLTAPLPGQTISSPLTVTGQARGNWYFEAGFPVILTDWDGKIIAQGVAQAQGDWMTTDFVPFKATLTFVVDKNVYSNRGSLILKKDNPSGLPANDDALEVPVMFAATSTPR
jgi:putative hemolysin